jgi:hypothetical protein
MMMMMNAGAVVVVVGLAVNGGWGVLWRVEARKRRRKDVGLGRERKEGRSVFRTLR